MCCVYMYGKQTLLIFFSWTFYGIQLGNRRISVTSYEPDEILITAAFSDLSLFFCLVIGIVPSRS